MRMHLIVKIYIVIAVNCIEFSCWWNIEYAAEPFNIFSKPFVINPITLIENITQYKYNIRREELDCCLK